MHSQSGSKFRTLLLLFLLLSVIALFDLILLGKQNEPQTYRSKAAVREKPQSPLDQNSLQSSYLIDELFDMTDADHAEIIDELVKELQGNASALERADNQLSASLERANYDGASQALVNLQQGLRDTGRSFTGAISLLDYHLTATSSATPTPIPPVENPENKQVLGTTDAKNDEVRQFTDKIKSIEDTKISEINTAKQSIAANKKSIEDANSTIISLVKNVGAIKNFCDNKQKFLNDLTADQNNLINNINFGQTKQTEAIDAYNSLSTEINTKITQIEEALKKTKERAKKIALLVDKVVLLELRKKIEDNKSSPPVVNDLDINPIMLITYNSIITNIQTLVAVMCGAQEEAEVRQTLNNMINDLSRIQGEINTLKTSTEKITEQINNFSAQIPKINQDDDKMTILTKLIAANNLLINVNLTLQKLSPLVNQLTELSNQLHSVKQTFEALKTKYQSNANLQVDITKASDKVTETERLLAEAEIAIQNTKQAITDLITSINNLIKQLNDLLGVVSQELQKPQSGGDGQPKSNNKNDYCLRYNSDKNDGDLWRFQVSCSTDTLVNGQCTISGGDSGSEIPPGKKCVRVGYIMKAREVGGIPVALNYKNLRVGMLKRDGSICACKANAPNQKWVGIKSFAGANVVNAAVLSAAAYRVYGKVVGGGDEGSRPIPQNAPNWRD